MITKKTLKDPQNKMFYYQDRNIELCSWKEDNFMQSILDKSVMLLGNFENRKTFHIKQHNLKKHFHMLLSS
jgi:hypothetical protein